MMTTTPEDAAYDEWITQILEENKDDIISEYVYERLGSYYLSHPDLDERAKAVLREAEHCLETSPTASLVISWAAIEIALKQLLLRPVVFGMVHDENTATVMAELLVGNPSFKRLLFHILEDHGLDIRAMKRDGANVSAWDELQKIKRLRNDVVHEGALMGPQEAQWAVELASFLVKRVYPWLRSRLIFWKTTALISAR